MLAQHAWCTADIQERCLTLRGMSYVLAIVLMAGCAVFGWLKSPFLLACMSILHVMPYLHAAQSPPAATVPAVNQDMAYILATGYVGTSILLAGFIIRPDMLQVKPMLWLSYVSYPRWVSPVQSHDCCNLAVALMCGLVSWVSAALACQTTAFSQMILLRSWAFQGLARNELEGVNFYPAGCVAQGMPGATADEIHKVSAMF